jgi:hypothetical protein
LVKEARILSQIGKLTELIERFCMAIFKRKLWTISLRNAICGGEEFADFRWQIADFL